PDTRTTVPRRSDLAGSPAAGSAPRAAGRRLRLPGVGAAVVRGSGATRVGLPAGPARWDSATRSARRRGARGAVTRRGPDGGPAALPAAVPAGRHAGWPGGKAP